MKFLITGGAGFIGSALIRYLTQKTNHTVINLDKLTYAGNLESLKEIDTGARYSLEQADICDVEKLRHILRTFQPDAIVHLAAESHVDRSIDGPEAFIETNIVGTYRLLEATREYWSSLNGAKKTAFRFHLVSTDEVFGSLKKGLFTEQTPYNPSSPYSASKASADHLVRAWNRTYGLPAVISNCSNNYGPYQFPEKLIPLMIISSLNGSSLPVYGDGNQVRDWLYVEDHVRALYLVATKGRIGETYNVGGSSERSNLEVVREVCTVLDELAPDRVKNITSYQELITHVPDRPGHDLRYAIDASKIKKELNWEPKETFETGIRKTVQWYLDNEIWWRRVLDGTYQCERLGLGVAV